MRFNKVSKGVSIPRFEVSIHGQVPSPEFRNKYGK
jgi:hypothetical protein